jgi:hypothetical protein
VRAEADRKERPGYAEVGLQSVTGTNIVLPGTFDM